MKVVHRHRRRQRRSYKRLGTVAVLMALLLVPLLSFVAFCVDVGWITKTKNELQNAADASASAGARQLADNFSAYSVPAQSNGSGLISSAEQNASTYIMRYGQYNGAGDVRSLSILSTDIRYGFTDANRNFTTNFSGYPNTVQVMTRRDSSANGPLSLFFGRVMGVSSESLTASAGATIYTGLISSFSSGSTSSGSSGSSGSGGNGGNSGNGNGGSVSSASTFRCTLLPVAFDVNTWNQFFTNGSSPDGNVYTDSTGTAQIQIYPSPDNAPGNFGLLDIGPWTNATPDYSNWILNGPSSSDIQYLLDNGELPVSQSSPKAWKGSPGLRNTLKSDFSSIIGQPRLLPLFKPASTSPYQAASGVGSNASYQIVGFVGVTVTEVTGNGSNLNISVKPCDVLDPAAIYDPSTVYPVGAQPSGQLQTFTHPAPKLTL